MASAVAPIRPLAWELPYVNSVAVKKKKKSRYANKNINMTDLTSSFLKLAESNRNTFLTTSEYVLKFRHNKLKEKQKS